MERDRDEPGDDLDSEGNSVWMTVEDKAKARRLKLYNTLKERGDLGTYYYLYPDERPKGFGMPPDRQRDGDGRER